MKFIGREQELARIREKLENDRTECLLVYGRRRVGKSELIKEALRDLDTVVVRYICRKTPFAQNMEGLSRAVAKAFNDKYVKFTDLESLLEYVCHKARERKVVLFIDEYPFLRGDNEAVDSEFQIAIDNWQNEACLKLILCGSYMETMQKLVESSAPLFGRFSEIMKIQPFDYYDAAKFFPGMSPEDKLLLYSVFGGVPFYLRQIRNDLTPEQNIETLLIPEGSMMENEIRLQLTSELSKEENANYVLEKIASGIGKYSDLADNFPGSNGKISHTLGKLEGMGLIAKDSPINATSNRRRHRYVICDNLLDFYYSYLFRDVTGRTAVSPQDFFNERLHEPIETDYLPRKFEQVAKEYLLRQNRAGKIQPPFMSIGRYVYNDKVNHRNGEFDVVTKDRQGLISYECKYRKTPLTMKVVHEEEWQNEQLGMGFYKLGFFSRSGFSKDVDGRKYKLITLADMYA